MSDYIIRIEYLGKRYRIGERDPDFSPLGNQYVYVDFSTGRAEVVVRDTAFHRLSTAQAAALERWVHGASERDAA